MFFAQRVELRRALRHRRPAFRGRASAECRSRDSQHADQRKRDQHRQRDPSPPTNRCQRILPDPHAPQQPLPPKPTRNNNTKNAASATAPAQTDTVRRLPRFFGKMRNERAKCHSTLRGEVVSTRSSAHAATRAEYPHCGCACPAGCTNRLAFPALVHHCSGSVQFSPRRSKQPLLSGEI